MQLSGAAAACAAAGGPARVLHALVSAEKGTERDTARSMFSACDMCFNKCGLIARVEDGVITKPIKNLRFTQSILDAFAKTDMISSTAKLLKSMYGSFGTLAPAARIQGFRFTGTTDF